MSQKGVKEVAHGGDNATQANATVEKNNLLDEVLFGFGFGFRRSDPMERGPHELTRMNTNFGKGKKLKRRASRTKGRGDGWTGTKLVQSAECRMMSQVGALTERHEGSEC